MSVIGADTIEWAHSDKGDYIMYRVPRNVQYNDNVVVREDEFVVFFRDGKALHLFDRPGRYALTTQNIPVLASIVKGLSGVQQVGELYYLQQREMRGKFGTKEPLTFRDQDFGLVRLRMFGQFSYRVVDPILFITQFVGAMGYSHSEEVIDWMKAQLVMNLNDVLGELKRDKGIGVADLPAYLEELEQLVLSRIGDEASRYGLQVMKVVGINVNLPEEVQEAVDARASMGVLGADYMQYQTGKAIRDIPGSGGGGGGTGDAAAAGLGLGVGAGMGMAMPGMIQGQQGQGASPGAPPVPSETGTPCPACGAMVPAGSKFCPSCGAAMTPPTEKCVSCGAEIETGAKFCPECGAQQNASLICPKCDAQLPLGTKFCSECGNPL